MKEVYCQHCYKTIAKRAFVVDDNTYCTPYHATLDADDLDEIEYADTHGKWRKVSDIVKETNY